MLVRLVVYAGLLGVTLFFQLTQTYDLFVDAAIPLYVLIAATFLLSILYSLSLPLLPDLRTFSFVQFIVDAMYATVLIHFTGGASSVFTLLYIFPIISAGILHFRRGALLIASTSSILFGLLVAFEFHGFISPSRWPWVSPWATETQSYVLWLLIVHFTFFYLVAILAGTVAEQLQKATFFLNLKESDYERLSDLHSRIVRSIPSGIITTDETDRITFVNAAGAALLRTTLSNLVSVRLGEVFPIVDSELTEGSAARKTYLTVKEVNGERLHLELMVSDLKGTEGTPRGRLVVFNDVTLLRRMEERVKASEKQTALVRIAAGMAHEVRNPLAALRAATELLEQTSISTHQDKRLLNIVIREADRLNALVGDFLSTVASPPATQSRILLTNLLEETLVVLAREPRVGRTITLETLINKGVEVEGEPALLRQALWNLFANAVDAIEDSGVIRVVLEAEPGSRQAVIKVQDSGCGIPDEIRDRIFEPFTTTKEKGTGLGLSMVLNAVQVHNGTIEADSIPGSGTLFTIKLPLAPAETSRRKEESNDG